MLIQRPAVRAIKHTNGKQPSLARATSCTEHLIRRWCTGRRGTRRCRALTCPSCTRIVRGPTTCRQQTREQHDRQNVNAEDVSLSVHVYHQFLLLYLFVKNG